MLALAETHQVWTFEDLLALPDDVEWRRYEIVDGALVMSPSVNLWHEGVSAQLRAVLREAGLPDFRVVGPIAVDLHPSYRIPDLIVVTAERMRTDVNPLPSSDALLVVEIVSPGSQTTDRVTKPAQYAAYGIPVYLRVETRPVVTLTAYELMAGAPVYSETGAWGPGKVAHLDRPFAVDIPIDELIPGR